MTAYSEEFERLMKSHRYALKHMERHRELYRIVDELRDTMPADNVYISSTQYSMDLTIRVNLKEGSDKSFPGIIEELLERSELIIKRCDSSKNPESGTVSFYYKQNSPQFGEGDRPALEVIVDFSSLCRRVRTGSRLVEDYKYICEEPT